MDWNDLQYVLVVSREGSLLGAARALGVAHTTVGRRLKLLEQQLGVRLFERLPSGYVPTAAGEDLASAAKHLESEVLSAENRILGRDTALRGSLKIATVDSLFYAFTSAFTAFVERYPLVELTVSTSTALASLARREADVVLRLSGAPPESLVGRKVGQVQFGVYASEGLVRRVGEDAPLSAFPWIGWRGGPNQRWFDKWLLENAPGAQTVLRLDDRSLVMAHAVRVGIGVQILPCFLADMDPSMRRLVPLDHLFQLGLWVLTLPELRSSSRVRAFVDHMTAALREERPRLAGASQK